MDRWTERWIDIEIDKKINRKRDRQIFSLIDLWMERELESYID